MVQLSRQKIRPCLWFNKEGKEAADFYCRLFPNSGITAHNQLVVDFTLDGQEFMALNGGPQYTFTEAISLLVHCDHQPEIDFLWENLTARGGRGSQCGWCQDRYGLWWQLVPRRFIELAQSHKPENIKKMFAAMMTMRKLDISELELAYNS
jgi:predicted 3-demethylubiquinone-9 3-methyltransferase (glyoxalase superfamily)